jgi:hypothetical protein
MLVVLRKRRSDDADAAKRLLGTQHSEAGPGQPIAAATLAMENRPIAHNFLRYQRAAIASELRML